MSFLQSLCLARLLVSPHPNGQIAKYCDVFLWIPAIHQLQHPDQLNQLPASRSKVSNDYQSYPQQISKAFIGSAASATTDGKVSLSLSVTKIGTWTASLCNCEKMWTACSHCPPEQLGNDGLKCRVNKYVNQYEPLGESCAWSTWLLMRIIKRSLVHPRTHHHNHRHRCHHRRWFQRPYSSPRTRTHSMAPFSQALIAAQKVTTVARSLWRFKSWERLTCRPWGEGQFGWKWWAMIDEKDWFASVFGRQTALQNNVVTIGQIPILSGALWWKLFLKRFPGNIPQKRRVQTKALYYLYMEAILNSERFRFNCGESQLLCQGAVRTSQAICQCPAFSQALMTALQVMTLHYNTLPKAIGASSVMNPCWFEWPSFKLTAQKSTFLCGLPKARWLFNVEEIYRIW